MLALMMDRALNLPSILEYAAAYHGEREVVTRTVEGPIHRYGYAEALARAKRMANALIALGVKPGDRVATLAWSTHRHFELYFAVSGIGAVLHTINPRLHPDQVVWVADHAEDAILLFDITFGELVRDIAPKLSTVKTLVAMTDRAHLPPEAPPGTRYVVQQIGRSGDHGVGRYLYLDAGLQQIGEEPLSDSASRYDPRQRGWF